MSKAPAVVLLSGGLDSTTVLAIARAEDLECHCLTVDYGQRHRVEIEAAKRVSDALGAASHRVITLDLRAIGGSALTDDIEVPKDQDPDAVDVPVTYVPARNTVLLSLLLGLAEVVGADQLFIGANAVDYSGYPDCRPAFLQTFEDLAALATVAGAEHGVRFRVRAPLLELSKADIIRRGLCGRCDSCQLRHRGFEEAGISDPTTYPPR